VLALIAHHVRIDTGLIPLLAATLRIRAERRTSGLGEFADGLPEFGGTVWYDHARARISAGGLIRHSCAARAMGLDTYCFLA
jgi:hypothetical protein